MKFERLKAAAIGGALGLLLLVPSHALANVIYTVHDVYHPGSEPVDGTITTDGNFDVLTAANIVAWDLTISGAPLSPFTLTNANSTVSLSGSGLTATPVVLLFNYDVVTFLSFFGGAFNAGFVQYQGGPGGGFHVGACTNCENPPNDPRSGIGVVGVVTPLPAALPLFAGGLGLIGLLARRRKQKATSCVGS